MGAMPGRRADAWILLGLLLGGCDPKAQRELEAAREELAAMSTRLRDRGLEIEALTVELDKVRAARAACEAERARPVETDGAPPAEAPPAGEPPPGEATLTPICTDGVCVVKRGEIEAFLARPEAVVRMARVIPAIEAGKSVGFKLFAIRPESPLALVGFKNGDLVRTVAGQEVHDMDAMLRAYSQLRTLDRWTFTGTRKSEPFEVTIVVQ